MLTTILLVLFVATIGYFGYRRYHEMQQEKLLKYGDLAKLKSPYSKDYPGIPVNNVLHILGIEGEYVKVEYIHFKDGSYHKEDVSKEAIRKVSKTAA